MEADTLTDVQDRLREEAATERPAAETPEIGIIMGSDSDLDVMMGSETGRPGAYDALTDLGFAEQTADESPDARFTFETYVVSAHRTPKLMYTYAETAADRGLDVIIAGAGGKSADLPNMTASIAYPLPVIGVPVQEKSLPSVIGMPQGAPIVAVDAGKSFNAALSAVQILAREHEQLRDQLQAYHDGLQESVATTSQDVHSMGTEAFKSRRDE
ncbi:5-(carboxyamino)imidazole ribonucleotide mutase [Halovenus aranensis]|jgi:5-(carboxyamino)imidazole ribonucleotide mutase|uniref:N5-carboxyaminoimidazole ribonucleotide mutase n=1 Tax=Halovenus aranensis TaxID=890420 RepID=A0A1G8T781_9EURY|nr:5-(carboxyamino)imidazole ribonucleotide mutase [Halovenus aranensis]SDJ36520.1 5-(carboxyamino)imidazole ribonucleotide mutase [Halovenus aranensis]